MNVKKSRIRTQRIHGRFEVAAITDRGNVRKVNEDGFLVDQHLGLIIVADGMSGRHDVGGNGAEAAVLAIKSIYNYLTGDKTAATQLSVADETIFTVDNAHTMAKLVRHPMSALEQVKEAIADANTRIYSLNQACGRPDRKGIGTTLVGLYWPSPAEGRTIIFHVGDCRAYRLRDNTLHRLTHDHSAIQKWIDNGLQGVPPAHNQLLRAVGPTTSVNADVSTYMLLPSDVILLCSNGLTTMVTDREITSILNQVANGLSVENGALHLLEMAQVNGGKDNITVVLGIL